MARRVRVPAADDLFRPTAVPEPRPDTEPPTEAGNHADTGEQAGQQVVELPAGKASRPGRPARTASGRVKHDEKMTVYVTSEELLDIEHARLELRRSHGLAVDRGRLVRAAVAIALAELDSHGDDSGLVRRLSGT